MLQPLKIAMRFASFTHESVTEPYDDGEADSSRLRIQSSTPAVARARDANDQYSFDLPIRNSKASCHENNFRVEEDY